MAKFLIDPTTGDLVPADQFRREPVDAASDLYAEPKHLGDGAYRFIDGEWVPLDGHNAPDVTRRAEGLQIIRDIEPYRAIASDIAADNKRPVIGGRRQHREFLKRNGYQEVGNSPVKHKPIQLTSAERVQDIRRAMRDI